jgi:chromosome segregation ATPase
MDPVSQNVELLNTQLASLTADKAVLETNLASTQQTRLDLSARVSELQHQMKQQAIEQHITVSSLTTQKKLLQLEFNALQQQLGGQIAGLAGTNKVLLDSLSEPTGASDSPADQRVTLLQGSVAVLEQRIATLDEELDASQQAIADARESLHQNELKITTLENKLEDAQDELTQSRTKESGAQDLLAKAQLKVFTLEADLKMAILGQSPPSTAVTIVDATRVNILEQQL